LAKEKGARMIILVAIVGIILGGLLGYVIALLENINESIALHEAATKFRLEILSNQIKILTTEKRA
jgi:membrane protein YqaA with SNARE-associated domain